MITVELALVASTISASMWPPRRIDEGVADACDGVIVMLFDELPPFSEKLDVT